MVWAPISWNYLGLIAALHGRINTKNYLNIIGDQILFPNGDGIFQNDGAPMHTVHVVKNYYEEH